MHLPRLIARESDDFAIPIGRSRERAALVGEGPAVATFLQTHKVANRRYNLMQPKVGGQCPAN
jgi:hypothetical protein